LTKESDHLRAYLSAEIETANRGRRKPAHPCKDQPAGKATRKNQTQKIKANSIACPHALRVIHPPGTRSRLHEMSESPVANQMLLFLQDSQR
jgi:hypothetical protein